MSRGVSTWDIGYTLAMNLLSTMLTAIALSSFGSLRQDPHPVESPSTLAEIAHAAATDAIRKFADRGLNPDQLGITLSRLDRSGGRSTIGTYRGDQPMYPASVVKLFYLAYAGKLLDDHKLELTPELERAVHDMIVESVNDATGLVLDTITQTTGGPELAPKALAAWMRRRQVVNRWFASLGYPKLNASQKTWNEGPYGRERQAYGPHFELRNALSPDVCVRLMSEIALDRIASPARCEWMRKYLSRAIPADGLRADGVKADEQSAQFSGKVLPAGTKLWSKAGWTSDARHDVAWVKFPDGREYVWAIFTQKNSTNDDLIPFLADHIVAALGEKAAP